MNGVTFWTSESWVRAVGDEHAHQGDVAILGGQEERRRANHDEVIATHRDVRRALGFSVVKVEWDFLPGDPNVRVGAARQQRAGECQAVADRMRREAPFPSRASASTPGRAAASLSSRGRSDSRRAPGAATRCRTGR